jgi:Zn-dependent metalloprotease
MKRSTLRTILVLSALGLSFMAGCGSSSDDAAPKPAGSDLEARLLADTGVRWIVDRDEASRPLFLTAPDAPPPIAGATPRDRAALEFLQRYADAFGVHSVADELVLKEDAEDLVSPGVHHLRFAQRIPGTDIRVFGADTFAHFDASGALRFAALGFAVDIGALSTHPARTADEARDAASASVHARDAAASVMTHGAPELVVYRAQDGKGTLAWRVVLQARVSGTLEAPELFVDAETLRIIEANDTAAHATKEAKASNLYYYHGDCGRVTPPTESTIQYDDAYLAPLSVAPTSRLARDGDQTKSTIVTDRYLAGTFSTGTFFTEPTVTSDPTAWDVSLAGDQGSGAAVSTHENLARADAYFRTSFGQRGLDDLLPGADPAPIQAAVHAWDLKPKDPKKPGLPAKVEDVTGYISGVLYFGDGLPTGAVLGTVNCQMLPSGVALDIVAHELTHGIVDFTARLGNSGEAGAINEGLADVLGAGAEHSLRPGEHNWIIGEDAWIGDGGLRSLAKPRSFAAVDPSEKVPRAYSERLPTQELVDNDRGHVHDNGVIVGHAYYLMTVGGRNEKTLVVVPPSHALGWERAQFLWYLTLRGLDRRFGTTIRSLARVNTNLSIFFGDVTAAACAWRAVDVFTDADLRDYHVTCDPQNGAVTPPPPPPASSVPVDDCVGRPDGVVCSDLAPSSASICKNGARQVTSFCADPGQMCKRASASDPRGSLDGDGALACE